ncbi:hypothetical protein GP486_005149 [Trichoglossum hirsutum]|uniref:DUF6594 domain-containing protein n=1 Tax=Trichoglossum hirsutum TaxID=265104 RepID=A0A9P8RMS1_9PEZI|nr:hypothetical protein GP486_005149 [Trichoglossum hirsutum]
MENLRREQPPPQDVVIPIPNEEQTGVYSDDKKPKALDASPTSKDTWDSAQTLGEGIPPEAQVVERKCKESNSFLGSSPSNFRPSQLTIHPPTAPRPQFTTKTRILDECPLGYPRLACFSASDHNFMIYRSFSYLHARCLHYVQDELTVMERELDELDEDDEAHEDEAVRLRLRCRGREDWVGGRRAVLVKNIKAKLDEYDELLFKAKTLSSFQRPSRRDYKSVRAWFYNEEPLVRGEQGYIECKEDLVTLRTGRECAGFDGWVEDVVRMFNRRLTRELRAKTSNKDIHYFSSQRLDRFVALLIAVIILVLLVLPVVALVLLEQRHRPQQPQQTQPSIVALTVFRCIGVLMVFTLTFSAVMSMLTKAKRHEVFASSAA